MPGFIDTHVHMPQLEVIASFGTELLHWLETYTFPAELRYADPAVCAAGSSRFLDALLAHGTTAAVVFPTVHKASAEALFVAAEQRGMRVVAGKCLMDRNAPPGLTDTLDSAERDSVDLIERWHGRSRGLRPHRALRPDQQRCATGPGRPPARRLPRHLPANPRGREPGRVALGCRVVPRCAQLPRRLCRPRPARRPFGAGAWHLAQCHRPRAARPRGRADRTRCHRRTSSSAVA